MKARRQAVLAELLAAGAVTSQTRAVALLAERDVQTTQATVSRDLEELGAFRVRGPDGIRYALTAEGSPYGISLTRVLREFVVESEASGPLAVLRTPPGHASMVAAALDRAHIEGILGTVAGDDTLFVCADEKTQGAGVLAVLTRLADRTRPEGDT
ncbi:MAG: arginine repressor [Acidimicrobiia bacterium]|nr:arginine repressor [Acidimicrobiia bacterium]